MESKMAKAKTDIMERFAFDAFVCSMSRFNIKTDLPTPDCSENTYENPDFILVISSGIIFLQLAQRDILKAEFEAEFKLNGLKKFLQISKLLEERLEEMDRTVSMPLYKAPDRDPFERSIESLALINELIQFLYSKNLRLFLNKLASFWRNYFASYQDKFAEKGGLSSLYSEHFERFKSHDEKINNFIPKYCVPYGRNGISVLFAAFCIDSSWVDGVKPTDKMGTVSASSLMKNLSIASKSPRKLKHEETEESCSLENPGLGIPEHRTLLWDTHSVPTDKETSDEKLIASIKGESVSAYPDEKLLKNVSGQTIRKQVEGSRQLSTHISSPEGRPKDRRGLIGSPLSPEERLKRRGGLTGSPLSPKERSKTLDGSSGSPLSPEDESKGPRSLSGSPASPQEQKLRRGSRKTPEGISRLEQKRQKLRQRKNLDNFE